MNNSQLNFTLKTKGKYKTNLLSCAPQSKVNIKAEELFKEDMFLEGWEVTKKGWPDYICWKDGKIILVEVKRSKTDYLSKEQVFVLQFLASYGIPCYRWDATTRRLAKVEEFYSIEKPTKRRRRRTRRLKSIFDPSRNN